MSYYTAPKPGSKIIIVGGGAFGLSTAYALALKKKYDIWVFDRAASIPAPDAASTGKDNVYMNHMPNTVTHALGILL